MADVLLIKNDGIGDLILASGLITSLSEHFGGNVDLVTCQSNQEIAGQIKPLRDRFYVSRDSMWFSSRAARFGLLWSRAPAEDKAVLAAIKSRHYDVAICLRRYIRQSSFIMMQAARAKRKLCCWDFPTNTSHEMAERWSRGWEHYKGNPSVLSELTHGRMFLESALGIPLDERPRLNGYSLQQSVPGSGKIMLGIGGSTTKWPLGNWIELATLLTKDGWKLILAGGPDSKELAAQIIQKVPSAHSQVAKLSFAETATILGECDAFIGNDTGIAHLASLVVRKCFVILGGGTFRRFFPWPEARNQHLLFHSLDCFDCTWRCKFADRYCLSLIRPRDVVKRFDEVMTLEDNIGSEFDLNVRQEHYQPA